MAYLYKSQPINSPNSPHCQKIREAKQTRTGRTKILYVAY